MLADINERARSSSAEVIHEVPPVDDLYAREEAHDLRVTPDSVSWINDRTGRLESIPFDQLVAVRFVRHGTGALEGGGIGAGTGVALGIMIGFGSGDDPKGWFSLTAEEKAAILGIGLGATGGLVGAITGAIIGSKNIFVAQPGTWRLHFDP